LFSALSFVIVGLIAVVWFDSEKVPLLSLVQENLLALSLILIGIIAVNITFTFLITDDLIKSVRELQSALTKFSQGDQKIRPKVLATNELGNLTKVINQLLENRVQLEKRWNETLQELQKERDEATTLVNTANVQNQAVQLELMKLIKDVEGASSGDLTVRAEITEGQIGIVADFFNALIESTRDIVVQVKNATSQLNQALSNNEGSMQDVATEFQRQAKKIQRMLGFVEQMVGSIQEVALNAANTAKITRNASQTAETGRQSIDLTVQSILELRNTVGETAKKVKRLGESSQQISKVISLINQIALQTNLLAINASIEAARAGEEGRGFAVVAEEVGQLAAQSAAATKEIEVIVENIQSETSEVVAAMEVGTSQVVEGTRLVEQAKRSLTEILEVSQEIDQLVDSISKATVSQSETSKMVGNLMTDIAKTSEKTADSARQVSSSLQETVNLAQQLQESVGTFKVEIAS
jgi:methyl-accepting chemotaxis protein PixJ